MHLNAAGQLQAKQAQVADALQRIAKLDAEVLPCIPSPQDLGYRNKIQLPVSNNLRLGLYARNTHDLVEIDNCHIHCPLGEKVLGKLQQIFKDHPGAKELKAVLIRTAVRRQQVLVVLVTQTRQLCTDLAKAIMDAAPEIQGVVQNIHLHQTNTLLGSECRTLCGKGWIERGIERLVL